MYNIRTADVRDIDALCALERECFSSPWSADAFSETMRGEGAVFFVCEADGAIVGYAGGLCVLDECSITNVAVTEEYRRRGISRVMLGALEREAAERGASVVFLEVRVSNVPAVSAYESMGYERCGVRRGFYRKPTEDAYVYKKELKE